MNNYGFSVRFLGGAGITSGSAHLLTVGNKMILVDCGLFHGLKSDRVKNWADFPVPPEKIDLVLLSHAHLDHSGLLPVLVRQGFTGQVWCTEPTREIAGIMLGHYAEQQERLAEQANREGFSVHAPARALFTRQDVDKLMEQVVPKKTDIPHYVTAGIACRFVSNGHMPGSAWLEVLVNDQTLLFSGDIGRNDDLLMLPPVKPTHCDFLFLESTLGDKIHSINSEIEFTEVINRSLSGNSTLLITGYSTDRAQSILHVLTYLRKSSLIPDVPVYVDNPGGKELEDVCQHFPSWHRIAPMGPDDRKGIHFVQDFEETLEAAIAPGPKIIIAGNESATGGRILTYFLHHLPDPSSTILLLGFQGKGTRGRRMLDGEKEIKMFGQFYPVRANIRHIDSLSSHCDQEGILDWLSEMREVPGQVFLVHGEAPARTALAARLRKNFRWDVSLPADGEEVELIFPGVSRR